MDPKETVRDYISSAIHVLDRYKDDEVYWETMMDVVKECMVQGIKALKENKDESKGTD